MATRWQALLIVVAVTVSYSNSFSGPFVLDDQSSVVQNPEIRDLTRLGRVLVPSPNSPVAGRPLASLSFALNYATSGLDVRGYHVLNLLLHLACALLLYGTARRTFDLPSIKARLGHRPADLAFAVALLWALHPLNTEVVDYITQRTESLMAACLVLTLYASLRAHTASTGPWHGLAIAASMLGVLSKETMVVAPVLVVLYDRVFLFPSWRAAWRERGRLYMGLGASWFVLGALVMSGPRAAVGGFSAGVTVWTYLLNQAVAIVDYLRLSVWPTHLVVFYGWPEALTLSDVAWPAGLVVALLATTVVALFRMPALGFLGAWFFVTLAPTSSVVPIATEVAAERRMYLPLMALAVLAAVAVDALVARLSPRADGPGRVRTRAGLWASAGLLAAASVGLAAGTVVRNRDYASGVTLAQTIVDRRPTAVAFHILGEQLALAKQNEPAAAALERAVALGDSRARYQLGVLRYSTSRFDEAVAQLDAFVNTAAGPHRHPWLEPPATEVLTARLLLAQMYAVQRRWADAAAQAKVVLDAVPGHLEAQRVRAAALYGQQRWPEAIAAYRQYLAPGRQDSQALINFGVALVATGELDEAIEQFTRAVAADPANANARQLLEMARRDRQNQPR